MTDGGGSGGGTRAWAREGRKRRTVDGTDLLITATYLSENNNDKTHTDRGIFRVSKLKGSAPNKIQTLFQRRKKKRRGHTVFPVKLLFFLMDIQKMIDL